MIQNAQQNHKISNEKCSITKIILIPVEKRVPWIGGGIGIFLGVIIVILDNVFTKKPTLSVIKSTWSQCHSKQ